MCNANVMLLRKKVCLIASLATDILESSESSSSSDEEETIVVVKTLKVGNFNKRKPVRIRLYMEVVGRYNAIEFQSHFRMTREAFEMLLTKIGPMLKHNGDIGRFTVDAEKQILAVLWLLSTPDSYRSVGERFDMGKSSLSVCFMRVIKAINTLAKVIIRWPQDDELREIEQKFIQMARIPSVIGAVDGTYIPIKAPQAEPEVYVTRKCFHAITLQAICIPTLKFTNIFVGYPGSCSDSRIFKNSDIYQEIRANHARYFPNNQCILGDKAYPTLTWCIAPFINRRQLTPAQINFNVKHAQTRQCIERSFALLFGRFRRLKFMDMHVFKMIPAAVLAACVLHNICLNHEDLLLNNYILEGQDHIEHNEAIEVQEFINDDEINVGRVRRNNVCEYLYNNRD